MLDGKRQEAEGRATEMPEEILAKGVDVEKLQGMRTKKRSVER